MKKCIYVVEDNPSIREIIEFPLIEDLYEVKTCPNTNDFWFQMSKHLPDMVILDIMLPVETGWTSAIPSSEILKHTIFRS